MDKYNFTYLSTNLFWRILMVTYKLLHLFVPRVIGRCCFLFYVTLNYREGVRCIYTLYDRAPDGAAWWACSRVQVYF